MMHAQTRNSRLVPVVVLCILTMIVCWVLITEHARTAHAGEILSSMEVYRVLDNDAHGGHMCRQLIIAYCPYITNAIQYAKYKVACRVNGSTAEDGLWILGVFAPSPDVAGQQVYITGYALHWRQLQTNLERDHCVMGDTTWLAWIMQ